MIIRNIFINQYITQKINRRSMPWMLKGRTAQLQARGGRTHRSSHEKVVNLHMNRKEKWEKGTF